MSRNGIAYLSTFGMWVFIHPTYDFQAVALFDCILFWLWGHSFLSIFAWIIFSCESNWFFSCTQTATNFTLFSDSWSYSGGNSVPTVQGSVRGMSRNFSWKTIFIYSLCCVASELNQMLINATSFLPEKFVEM